MSNKETGNKGEQLAAEYLLKKGFRILHTNWRFEKCEADIIAEDDDMLVIVEVKTRSTDFFGSPAEAVNKQKQRMMVRSAEAYLEQMKLDKEVRYDVVAIIMNNKETTIEHIEDAFYPFASELD